MEAFVAALPMYDWPECRAKVDAQWALVRARLLAAGIAAPQRLARRNADLPPVPGGIRDSHGVLLATDPAMLSPDEFDLHALWRHPRLLFAQTCWGPMEGGLSERVEVVGQPDYSDVPGGNGPLYSSVLLMRAEPSLPETHPPAQGRATLPLDRMQGLRLAFNGRDSMSGFLALSRDLEAAGAGLDIFARRIETGSHRGSIRAVSDGTADIAAIDCRSWALARQFEPAARSLVPAGWTAQRPGLPFITGPATVTIDWGTILRGMVASAGSGRADD